MTFRKDFSLSLSLFQLSMHLINAVKTLVAEYFWLYSLIQFTCHGVSTGKNYIGVGRNI